LDNRTDNPFRYTLRGGITTEARDAATRIRAVQRFNVKQCTAALDVRGLQESVREAIGRRLARIARADKSNAMR
jgi:hypothetical protein